MQACMIAKRVVFLAYEIADVLNFLAPWLVRHVDRSTSIRLSLGSLRDAAIALGAQLVRRLALHDLLTGLPNRTLLRDRLGQELARARREGGLVAVLLLDLDRFRDINDTLGHPVGDQLLCAVGQRISAAVRATDTLARLGGDEFALCSRRSARPPMSPPWPTRSWPPWPCRSTSTARRSMSRPASASPCSRRTGRTRTRCSSTPSSPSTAPRRQGRDQLRFFEPAMDEEAQARRRLERELRQALERGEFVLHYQPQLELATGRFAGVEALVRWHHPERGLVPPGAFIPAAEASGLIRPLGAWVLREACRQANAWRGARLGAVRRGQPLAGPAAPQPGPARRSARRSQRPASSRPGSSSRSPKAC